MDKKDIKSFDFQEMENFIREAGEKEFRAKQVYEWIHKKLIRDVREMTNIPKKLMEYIEENCEFVSLKPVKVLTSEIDNTQKYLFELSDGSIIESVLMPYHHGNSVCISTQVGCRMGCRFCASTLDGLERNLKPSEMLDEIYMIQKMSGQRVSNIVLMGSGEPLDNFHNVTKFINLISDKNGLNISQRNITLSTCGLVPNIYKLADMGYQITLALSLHASDDETRKQLMPVANAFSIEDILKACRYYFEKTGRRVTFEYSLVSGVNDTKDYAKALGRLLKGMSCHVNLIPVNPIKERNFRQTGKSDIQKFKSTLEGYGIRVTVRREMGRDINGACGQLRRSYKQDREL